MRAGRYYFFNAIIIQDLYILIGHHLKHKFITGPANRIAGTHFFFAKNSIVDLQFI